MSNSTAPSTVLPPGYALGSYWYYAPNKGAPIAFAFFFTVSCIWHLVQCHRFNSYKATLALVIAALIFTAGFVLRAIGAWHYDNINIYISSTVMLLASPPIYEAANFFTLGRILYYVPYHAPMHPGRVVTTFAGLQAIVEAFNGNGGSRVANPSLSASQQDIGKALLKTALLLQLFCMAAFMAIAVRFDYNCRRGGRVPANLRRVLIVLYVSCLLITTRTVYRTVEWFQDLVINVTDPSSFPPVLKHEWFFWVFEATLLVINTFLLNIFHPSRYLPRNLKIYLAPDGVTEMEGRGFEDKRPFWQTLIDPFDCFGLATGRDKHTSLWEQTPANGPQPTVEQPQGTEMDKLRKWKWKKDVQVA